MFHSTRKPRTSLGAALSLWEVIYHSAVRSVRKTHNNAFMALVMNILQTVIFVMAFYVMIEFMGMRGMAIRGDFLIYLLSGVFLFMVHTKTLGAVFMSEGPASPMMQHAPMNTIVSILSAALGALYVQLLSLGVILFVYHVAFTPFEIDDPAGAFAMLMLSWFTGLGLGVLLLSIKPWFPSFATITNTVFQRINMFASGKMFVANTLPAYMLTMFDWNPLFHIIDQARGDIFINYSPRYSNWEYPLIVGVVLLMVGLMGEFYTRRHASLSWSARR